MYYPAMLDIRKKNCLIIGGGAVAARKCKELLVCEAVIKVLSPEVNNVIAELCKLERLEWIKAGYSKDYLAGCYLCFVCTDNAAVNKQAAEDAVKAGILANVADDPSSSSFIVPAVRRKGSITIAASCSENPAATRFIADYLEGSLEEWMPGYINITHDIRQQSKELIENSNIRQELMKSLFKPEMLEFANKDIKAAGEHAEHLLEEYVRKEGE